MEDRINKTLEIYTALGIPPEFFLNISDESFQKMYDFSLSNKHFEPTTEKEYIVILVLYYDTNNDLFIKYFKNAIIARHNIDLFFYLLRNERVRLGTAEQTFNHIYHLVIDFLNDEIDNENSTAIYILGVIYDMKRDRVNESKYYQLAINYKYIPAILKYCQSLDLSDEEIIKTYQIGVEIGSPECIISLGRHYGDELCEYDRMMKLFTEVFDKYPDYRSIIYKRLNMYICDRSLNFDITLKLKREYILLSSRYNCINQETIDYLGDILAQKEPLDPEIIEFILEIDLSQFSDIPFGLKLIQKLYKEKIDLMELHYKYQPGEAGFKEAKVSFDKRITS